MSPEKVIESDDDGGEEEEIAIERRKTTKKRSNASKPSVEVIKIVKTYKYKRLIIIFAVKRLAHS